MKSARGVFYGGPMDGRDDVRISRDNGAPSIQWYECPTFDGDTAIKHTYWLVHDGGDVLIYEYRGP